MREDFSKILVERARIGRRWDDRQLQRRKEQERAKDFESAPKRESMRKRARYALSYTKELNENLKPLIRYLRSQVGRKWDDVYSEICKQMDRRDPVQLHIFQHIFSYVQTKVVYVNGKPHYYGFRDLFPLGYTKYGDLYLDPQGNLQYIKISRRTKIKPKNTKINIGTNEYIEIIDGIWYHTKYEIVERQDLLPSSYTGYRHSWKEEILVNKKQLSTKEKKKYGVS